MPSLAADSAASRYRRFTGTFFRAYFPPVKVGIINKYLDNCEEHTVPTIAAHIMGSVGVKQAEINKQDIQLSVGKRSRSRPAIRQGQGQRER